MAYSRQPIWEPSGDDYSRVFRDQNPWHRADGPARVPRLLAPPVERPLASCLWHRARERSARRFQLVLGPRRVGKTTCLYQTVQHLLDDGIDPHRIWWMRLDHPLLMRHPLDALVRLAIDIGKASMDRPAFLFLDELVYAKDWDTWLKSFYDEAWPVCIVGSSSSTAAIRDRRTESGVGRWEEQLLMPYSFGEFLELIGHTRIEDRIDVQPTLAETLDAAIEARPMFRGLERRRRRFLLTGGFPELLIRMMDEELDDETVLLESQRTLRNDAVERAIYKDIPQAFNIDNPMMLERLLYTLAGQVTGLISPTNLRKSLDGISQPTLDRYISYLERSFLIFTLQNYSGSEETIHRRGRKVYFSDTSIRNAALQRGLAPLNDAMERGLMLENLAASHLHALSQQAGVRLYHWREGQNYEVDLIYDHPEKPLAFEIAHSPSHSRRGLTKLIERHPKFAGRSYVVAPDASLMSARNGIGMLPLDEFLLCISAQEGYALHRGMGVFRKGLFSE